MSQSQPLERKKWPYALNSLKEGAMWRVDPLLGNGCSRHARSNGRAVGGGVLCAVRAEAI
jgi:hypothetical protein